MATTGTMRQALLQAQLRQPKPHFILNSRRLVLLLPLCRQGNRHRGTEMTSTRAPSLEAPSNPTPKSTL